MRIDALMPFVRSFRHRDLFDVAGFHSGESVATFRVVIPERWAYLPVLYNSSSRWPPILSPSQVTTNRI